MKCVFCDKTLGSWNNLLKIYCINCRYSKMTFKDGTYVETVHYNNYMFTKHSDRDYLEVVDDFCLDLCSAPYVDLKLSTIKNLYEKLQKLIIFT